MYKTLLPIIFFFNCQAAFAKSNSVLQFSKPDLALWERDYTLSDIFSGAEHYTFLDADDIDLNIISIDEDLKKSLTERGVDQFVQDILKGKNKINEMFTVCQTEILTYNLEKKSDSQILYLKTKQMIDSETLESVEVEEKYFIFDGLALNAQLRWQKNSDAQKIKSAQTAFSKFFVKIQSQEKK